MAFAIKRTYGKNHDYLHAWCEQWGTSCMGSIKKALIFASKSDAEEAAVKAQRVCKGFDGLPAKGITFSAVPA